MGYNDDFKSFLSCTNEKSILFNELSSFIKDNSLSTMLDVGAGPGDFALKLSKIVPSYTAVEKRQSSILSLKDKGLQVIEGSFPMPIKNSFDLVLFSHSLSSRSIPFKKKIYEGWKIIKNNGWLIIITYDARESVWSNFLKEISMESFGSVEGNIDDVKDTLSELSTLEEKRVITHVESTSIEEIFNALTFVASAGVDRLKNSFLEKREQVYSILKKEYFDGSKYSFPFEHVFLRIKKS